MYSDFSFSAVTSGFLSATLSTQGVLMSSCYCPLRGRTLIHIVRKHHGFSTLKLFSLNEEMVAHQDIGV